MLSKPEQLLSSRLTPERGHDAFFRVISIMLLSPVLMMAPAVGATDYFVRMDGSDAGCTGRSNAAYPGTGTGKACGWATVGRCAANIGGGDTCYVQPGTYVANQILESKSGGYLDNAASGCSCTKGSTVVTCTTGAANFVAGDFIQCDAGFGFYYAETASVSGTTITLKVAYNGPSTTSDTADRLRPIRYVGANGTTPTGNPLDVVITPFVNEPGDVSWTQDPTHPCVYSYNAGSTSNPTWKAPVSMREVEGTWSQAVAAWSLWGSGATTGKNKIDPYYKMDPGLCPCARSTVKAGVADLPGSWGIDGTTVYAQTYGCVDPDSLTMQATTASLGSGVFEFSGDNLIVENLTVESSGSEDPEHGGDGRALWLATAANQRIKIKNVRCHGRCGITGSTTFTDTLWENVLSTLGFSLGGRNNTNWSGVKFSHLDIRGNHNWGLNVEIFTGASASDPIVFDGLRVARTFSDANHSLCGYSDTWDCGSVPGSQSIDPFWASHGAIFGTIASEPNYATNHILIQNCVIENTYDGLFLTADAGDTNVKIRNCTFYGDHFIVGSANAPGTVVKIFNSVFLRDTGTTGGRSMLFYGSHPNSSGFESDYNALFVNDARGVNVPNAMPWWQSQVDTPAVQSLEAVKAASDDEDHTIVVCDAASSCASSTIPTFKISNPYSYFVDTEFRDVGGANFALRSGNPIINRGLNSECPETDFNGNPRNDGACDIGAFEYQGNVADTIPPAPATNFAAQDSGTSVSLSWRHSTSSDNRGTEIRVRDDRAPASPGDGIQACRQEAPPSTSGGCTWAAGQIGRIYYFSAYSFDHAGNYGPVVSTTGSAGGADSSPPGQVDGVRRTDTTPN